jgi:2-oxoglutarate ferredoxin oxidoreductase subunit beta
MSLTTPEMEYRGKTTEQGTTQRQPAGGESKLTRKDFVSDQDVRWCPGCGDYAILAQVQKVMPELGIPREKFVFISGIGCSSRFPYYMNTYGFHSIHGRAPAIASGLKITRPELSVWVITGDGDALSIGGNHLIHALRRNVDLNILLFNNRIYGLTKGQYSPTSEQGKITKSTPFGSVDHPFNPISVALGSEGSFVARTIDVEAKHLQEIVRRAYEHRGTSFVEILQNCNIFNDGAFEDLTAKESKAETQLLLEHGKPLLFGKDRDKGIRMKGHSLEAVKLGNGITEADIIVHDETDSALAFLLSLMTPPSFPTPIGVFRAVERATYEEIMIQQIQAAKQRQGDGDLDKLLNRGDTWTVS